MYRIGYQLNLNHTTTWCMEKLHFHDSVEILLCLSEGGAFYVDNKKYDIHNGSLFILKGSVLHRSISTRAYKRYVMHISIEELKQLSTAKTDLVSCVEHVSVHTMLERTVRDELEEKFALLERREEQALGSDLLKQSQLVDLLVNVFRAAAYTRDSLDAIVNPNFSKAEQVINYIQEHYNENLSLDSIATALFLNKFYICHMFKTATGIGVTEYIIQFRITKARDLLRKGYRVYEAGEKVGFHNNSHFIRTFRRLTGGSPKVYADQYLLSSMKESSEIFLETSGSAADVVVKQPRREAEC